MSIFLTENKNNNSAKNEEIISYDLEAGELSFQNINFIKKLFTRRNKIGLVTYFRALALNISLTDKTLQGLDKKSVYKPLHTLDGRLDTLMLAIVNDAILDKRFSNKEILAEICFYLIRTAEKRIEVPNIKIEDNKINNKVFSISSNMQIEEGCKAILEFYLRLIIILDKISMGKFFLNFIEFLFVRSNSLYINEVAFKNISRYITLKDFYKKIRIKESIINEIPLKINTDVNKWIR